MSRATDKRLLEIESWWEVEGALTTAEFEWLVQKIRDLSKPRPRSGRFAETVAELEEWLTDIGRTAQITYRVKLRPPWLVRISNYLPQDKEKHDRADCGRVYIQATGDTLEEAMERAVEAWMTDGFVDEAHVGRKKALS